MSILESSVKKMEFTIIFPSQEHFNKNGDVERKNRSVEEAGTFLNEISPPKYFWADGVSIVYYTLSYPNFVQGPLVGGMQPPLDRLEVLNTYR